MPADVSQAQWWVMPAVVGALGLLAAGVVLVIKAKGWLEAQIKAVAVASGPSAAEIAQEVSKSVAEAMRAHEDREQRWREDDRKDARERLRELQGRLDEDLREIRRRIERLEDAVQSLANRPATPRSSDIGALIARLNDIESMVARVERMKGGG